MAKRLETESDEERVKRISHFFTSRRRHTIFDCDWSTDVCPSDLRLGAAGVQEVLQQRLVQDLLDASRAESEGFRCEHRRSEERRVGKEGRSEWSPFVKKEMKHYDNSNFDSIIIDTD